MSTDYVDFVLHQIKSSFMWNRKLTKSWCVNLLPMCLCSSQRALIQTDMYQVRKWLRGEWFLADDADAEMISGNGAEGSWGARRLRADVRSRKASSKENLVTKHHGQFRFIICLIKARFLGNNGNQRTRLIICIFGDGGIILLAQHKMRPSKRNKVKSTAWETKARIFHSRVVSLSRKRGSVSSKDLSEALRLSWIFQDRETQLERVEKREGNASMDQWQLKVWPKVTPDLVFELKSMASVICDSN